MAKDNSDGSNSNNLSTPSSTGTTGTKRSAFRLKPYEPKNSLVRKVATKMTDLIPNSSWISKWFNNSGEETIVQTITPENPQYKEYDDNNLHSPPMKRPCIRMDVTHPPGTFIIKPRNRNLENIPESAKDHYSKYSESAQDFVEPTTSPRLQRFVSSTPAFSIDTTKVSDTQSTLTILMSEQGNGIANGMDDNSESSESTSGCSSLIPQNNRQETLTNANYNSTFEHKRRYIDEKLNFTKHLQSPKSLFLENTARETLSSRRPSFNALMMNNSLDRSSSLLSPFYAGNTIFGGANAANLYRNNSALSESLQYNLKVPKRTSVEVNPSINSSTSDLSGMSHTARRILEALEQFSSPLADVKKMPIKNIRSHSQTSSPTSTRKRLRNDSTSLPRVGLRHLTRELVVPTVPDILRIRRRQKLQNTTVNARKIMTSRVTTTQVAQDYYIRTENDVEPVRNTQLKAKKKMNLEKEETIESINLPTMPLPISSLPRFDISLPKCTKSTKFTNPNTAAVQSSMFEKNDSYKFASPIKLVDSIKNIESINNFTFSKPITPSKMISSLTMNESYDLSKTLSVDSNDTLSCSSSFTNFMWTGPSQTLKIKEKDKDKIKEELKGPKVASELKTGSVMDYFAKKLSSSNSSYTWECNECLIKNNVSDKYCMACKSSKPTKSNDINISECNSNRQESKTSSGSKGAYSEKRIIKDTNQENLQKKIKERNTSSFSTGNTTSSIFSDTTATNRLANTNNGIIASSTETISPTAELTKTSWECPCCMVHNIHSIVTCPCCNSAKPGTTNLMPKPALENVSSSVITEVGFGDQFKKPEGSWLCDICMIQNKSENEKCAACETPHTVTTLKPLGCSEVFKTPAGSWTCDSCMVKNKSEVDKCAACGSGKPDLVMSLKPKLQFNVDMPANASSFVFGIDKAGDTGCNTAISPKTNGFTFGNEIAVTQSITGVFSFGIPSSNKTECAVESKNKNDFNLKIGEAVATTATFQFGSKFAELNEDTPKTPNIGNFSFGMPTKSESKISSAEFMFGTLTDKKTETKEAEIPITAGFIFTPPSNQNNDSVNNRNVTKVKNEALAPGKFLFGSNEATFTSPAKEETSGLEKPQPTLIEVPKQSTAAFQQRPNFSFGSTSASTISSTSSPFFNDQSKSVTSASLSTFGSISTVKPTFTFGSAVETSVSNSVLQQPATKLSTMAFGSQSSTSSFPPQTNQSISSLFGNINSTSPTASSALGTNSSKPLFINNSENKVSPTFGESESKLPRAFSVSNAGFGSPSNVFGNAIATPNFGTNTSTSIFVTTKPSETPSVNPNLFSFGQSSQPTAPATSGFNFSTGSNINSTSEQKNIFSFGTPSSQVGNGFGSSSNFSSTTSSFNFNAPTKPETVSVNNGFGQMANVQIITAPPAYPGTSNSTSPSHTTSFSFGSTSMPTRFSFGTSSTPVTGGFNFNAPTNSISPVAFDPNVQPTFNFTAGSAPTTFNAPPARKIKKAVRRMPRQ